MDNAVQAIMMAFAAIVFVMALTLSMYMLSVTSYTSEQLTFYTDSTRYYDNIEIDIDINNADSVKSGRERIVSAETIVPILYRYNKENFCVKIYDDANNLVQIFDVNTENKVYNSIGKTGNSYQKLYNDESNTGYYLFGAPWTGSPEHIKTRVDLFINGEHGYINNQYINYKGNVFANSLKQSDSKKNRYLEQFISYSYSGTTMETEDGDILVTDGQSAKDKIVIIYTLLPESYV